MLHRYAEARELVKQGTPVDTTDGNGNSALMLSCREGHGRLVKLLVRKGAKVDAQNSDGLTAETIAFKSGHSGICKFLQDAKPLVGD